MQRPDAVDDVGVEFTGHVAVVELRRPPNNYFDLKLIDALADALERLDAEPGCRAITLCSAGRHFCAGADFGTVASDPTADPDQPNRHLYDAAVRLFRTTKPIVAAVQGAAIGGGLGLALAADFRVASTESRFSANFSQLGSHPGFGLTVTLPALVGQQRAMELLYSGRRVGGTEAHEIGLCDRLVDGDDLRGEAIALAQELATSAPLAIVAVRRTLRRGLPERVEAALATERAEQALLAGTADRLEGVAAAAERRAPRFIGE